MCVRPSALPMGIVGRYVFILAYNSRSRLACYEGVTNARREVPDHLWEASGTRLRLGIPP